MYGISFFHLALSFILIHEMDAIRCKEWRIFPILSNLEDKLGETIFILAHIPLCYAILVGLAGENKSVIIYWLDCFFVIHLGLHILLFRHPKNEFKDWISWVLIVGAAVFGAIDLLI